MITFDQQQKISSLLSTMPELASDLGTKEKACSIAAINLALTGELTDKIPDCMSEVIGRWVIITQDAAPAALCRDNPRWRTLLPLAAGTGREHEKERLTILLDWMWQDVLPQVQPVADKKGFGREWREMCEKRTPEAAMAADAAADAAAWAAETAEAARAAAEAAARAAEAARAARAAAEWAAEWAAAWAAAGAAVRAAETAGAAPETFWTKADPCGLLEKLINVGK